MNGGATWQLQDDHDTFGCQGVAFADGQYGWVVGDSGTILHTTDGGAMWTVQVRESSAGNNLRGVAFPNRQQGWAVGESGTIRHTTNAGVTWNAQASHTSRDLMGVAFADGQHGWAIGRGGTVLHTEDGGANWKMQAVGSNQDLFGVTVLDKLHGWAVGAGGTILQTTGGGAAWHAEDHESSVCCHIPAVGTVVTADMFSVAPRNPRAALATARDSSRVIDPATWAFRSADGGAHWAPLPFPDGLLTPGDPVEAFNWTAPIVTIDDLHLYLNDQFQSSPDASSQGVVTSFDGGANWDGPDNPNRNGDSEFGHQVLAVSPLAASEVYALDQNFGPGLQRSTDYGAHWSPIASPADLAPKAWDPSNTGIARFIPDARLPGRLYATIHDGLATPAVEAWSVNDGASWHRVTLPHGLQAPVVRIGLDEHLPGQLLLYPASQPRLPAARLYLNGHLIIQAPKNVSQPSLPADRLYGTADGGATWRQLICPGVLKGTCPSAVIDNTLGAGRSYGLYADGIHAFRGAGPAGPRLAVSDDLPLSPLAIRSLAAGPHAGDPIFVFGNVDAQGPGLIYRSADGGRHWLEAFAGTLPTRAAAIHVLGAVYIAATRHSVAPPFVPLYRSLGLSRIGYPIDEIYRRNGDLVQDFERLELVEPGGRGGAVIDALGQEFCALRCPRTATSAVGSSSAATYSVSGDFLHFWKQHGGLEVFGAPISKEFKTQNMDGTGRSYRMQYFTNARLEWHPGIRDPRFTVQIGLLGDEAVKNRGW